MTPPNLPADAPILNVPEPLLIDFLPMHRKETDQVLADHAKRFLGLGIMQKPLFTQPWLDRNAGAFTEADRALVRLGFRN